MKKDYDEYEAPSIEVISVGVEFGFQSSNAGEGGGIIAPGWGSF